MNRLITSDRVDGTTVYNQAGEKLGSVDHLVIDKVSGQVQYAALKFGSFLGMGGDIYPLPWTSLKYSVDLDGYVAPIDKPRLEGAPKHSVDTRPDYTESYGQKLGAYWGGASE